MSLDLIKNLQKCLEFTHIFLNKTSSNVLYVVIVGDMFVIVMLRTGMPFEYFGVSILEYMVIGN